MKKFLPTLLAIMFLPVLAACDKMGDAESYNLPSEPEKKAEVSSSATNETAPTEQLPNPWTSDDPFWGDINAPISMVVFSDFQCPFCGDFFLTLERLKTDWIDTGKLKIQYRDFPLSMHQNALPAHLAANAAVKQGRYMEMHRALFEHQKDWEKSASPEQVFEQYVQEWKLGLAEFQQAMKDPALMTEVQEDKAAGQARGISGTPGFFLNGKAYEGAIGYEDLLKLLANIE